MTARIATDSCSIKPITHLIIGCDIADTLQPMVAEQEADNAGFVARLNEALDGIKDVPRARGRRIALAKMMGMSGESARKWLAGETLPSMDNARLFAAKTGVQVDWLLTGRGSKHPFIFEGTATHQTATAQHQALALLPLASPRSAAVLELIAKAADEGRLSDADLGLLNQIAERLSAEPGTYDKLRKKADDADRASE